MGLEGGEVRLWNRLTQESVSITPSQYSITKVTWSPDGKWLACSSGGSTVTLWTEKGEAGRVLTVDHHCSGLGWSPDSQRLVVSGDGLASICNIQDNEVAELSTHRGSTYHAVWSSDGKTLVGAGAEKVVGWDGLTLEPLWSTVLLSNGQAVTFDPQGKVIAGAKKTVENYLTYVIENEDGSQELLSPSEFQKRAGRSEK